MNMASALLAIIYLAFISLGLPDSLLGSAWPVMQAQIQVQMCIRDRTCGQCGEVRAYQRTLMEQIQEKRN